MRERLGLFAWLCLAALLATFGVADAQGIPTPRDSQALPAIDGVTHAELVEWFRSSGLSRAEVRSRLQAMGRNPGLADRYYDVIERGAEPPRGFATAETLEWARLLGIRVPPVAHREADSLAAAADTLLPDTLSAGALPVFGRELFRRSTAQFQPLTGGPVDPDYRLGAGDQVVLVLTGDVELAHTLEVSREGFLIIPDVGHLPVAGLTMRQLEDVLYDRLTRVYSGVGRGAAASTQFTATLGQLRTNQVFLLGEVERPGAYQVSSVATVFNALYHARGPNDTGSFRRIEVRRGDRLIRTVDLYRYLLYGDSRDDIRLEQGDIIFVPAARARVGIQGSVRRSAIFELIPGEGLVELLTFAGGVDAHAVRRIQIDRIVPLDSRRPGVDRVLIDVDLERLVAGEMVSLRDGDHVQAFAVSVERRHRLVVAGEVRRPGVYEWSPGLTLWSLIDRAEGLREQAYTPRAHIFRLNEADGSRRLLRTPLLADTEGQPIQDVPLADQDSVVIYSRVEFHNPAVVHIDGFVKQPGSYALAEGTTLQDLILAAGGFLPGASLLEAEVARPTDIATRTNTTSRILRIPLVAEEAGASGASVGASGNHVIAPESVLASWVPAATEFELNHEDRVFIRRAPGYEVPRTVSILGQVMSPGSYVLEQRQERLRDLIQRSGGLTEEANPAGIQVVRDGRLVSIDPQRALHDPRARDNLNMEPGDSIFVPELDPTVTVRGAVGFESRVLHVPGRGIAYYIDQAGGLERNADRRRISVTYQNGQRRTRGRAWFGGGPKPEPGSTIFVPSVLEDAPRGVNWDQLLTRTMSIVTILVAIDRLR